MKYFSIRFYSVTDTDMVRKFDDLQFYEHITLNVLLAYCIISNLPGTHPHVNLKYLL